jgi:hypothetical protein
MTNSIENFVKRIKELDEEIDNLSNDKKSIDSKMSDCKKERDSIRESISQLMNENSSVFATLRDGTEISIRNGVKTFEWQSDDVMVDYLKSIGKFEKICTVETTINKRKLKSILDDLCDCDGLPDFVTMSQEKVLQIRAPGKHEEEKPVNKSGSSSKKMSIDDFDDNSLDGI